MKAARDFGSLSLTKLVDAEVGLKRSPNLGDILKRAVLMTAFAACLLGLCSTAEAAVVTVGSPLTATFAKASSSFPSLTLFNPSILAPAKATSPVSGVIVRWNLVDAEGSGYRLRVLRPAGGTSYADVDSSAPVAVPPSSAKYTVPADLPIQIGDSVGVDLLENDTVGLSLVGGSVVAFWEPALPTGGTKPFNESQSGLEYGFNAEVQPSPTVSGLSPASGTIKGGVAVTVAGTDFEGASAVSFGSQPATSFTIDSESQISAVAPASETLAKVPVTVTTIAGTATSAVTFTYAGCKVPKLKGKKLKAAKKALKKASCKIGKVKKVNGATSKTGKVKSQSPKTGKVLAPGSKVNVKLG